MDGPWFAFYTVKMYGEERSEIGVARSEDGGASWRHLGIALSEADFPLSSPWVSWDEGYGTYVMLPSTHWAHPRDSPRGRVGDEATAALYAYVTGPEEFPFGWKRAEGGPKPLLPPPALPVAVWWQGGRTVPLLSPVAVKYGDVWWLFGTEKTYLAWRWPWFSRHPAFSYKLRLFHSPSLLGGASWGEVGIKIMTLD